MPNLELYGTYIMGLTISFKKMQAADFGGQVVPAPHTVTSAQPEPAPSAFPEKEPVEAWHLSHPSVSPRLGSLRVSAKDRTDTLRRQTKRTTVCGQVLQDGRHWQGKNAFCVHI